MRREDTVRFLARIPYDSLWCDTMTRPYRLQLKTQHEGRYEEYLEQPLRFRTVEVREGRMSINGREIALRCREIPGDYTCRAPRTARRGIQHPAAAARPRCGTAAGQLRPAGTLCDRAGARGYAPQRRFARRVGGNPSNNPAWREAYVERALDSYHTTKLHPSVIAFALATQSANGINLYESYIESQGTARRAPVYLSRCRKGMEQRSAAAGVRHRAGAGISPNEKN